MKPYYDDDLVTLFHGDALQVAESLPSASVQTIVTSPPYFGLRDYGAEGQMGAEETLQGYVDGMVALFRELRRVLTDDGTLWLNLGDSYSRDPGKGLSGTPNGRNVAEMGYSGGSLGDVPPKNLIGVPWRVAFALQSDGWILRSEIIWAKPNAMPDAVKDRPTKAHEHIFLLSKSPRYYYDASAIAEPSDQPAGTIRNSPMGKAGGGTGRKDDQRTGIVFDGTRNKRTVWTIPTVPFSAAHFAVYPPELIRPCVLAGSRTGDTILDPFSGSGTTGMVATQEGRKYIGIDLNKDYLDLSLATRFRQPVLDFGSLVSSTERKES